MKTRTKKAMTRHDRLRALTNDELLLKLKMLTQSERRTTLKILAHLNEVDRRRLYLEQGYGSLFDYCTRGLRYSESAAGRRIRTARCIRDYPEVYALLAEKRLTLSTICAIAGVLNPQNKEELLDRVAGRSRRTVEAIVSSYDPRQRVHDRVAPVSVVRSSRSRPQAEEKARMERDMEQRLEWQDSYRRGGSVEWLKAVLAEAETRDAVEQRYKIEFAVNEDFMKKFEELRALLSTRFPGNATFEHIFGVLINEYLERYSPERKAKRRQAKEEQAKRSQEASKRPLASRPPTSPTERSRHVPAATRDMMFARDGGRCTYVGPNGVRCGSTWKLNLDHIVPFSKGGMHSIDNLRLLCAKHNQFEAERAFGKKFMGQFHRRE